MRHRITGTIASVLLWAVACSPTPITTGPSKTTSSDGQESKAPAGIAAAGKGDALVRFLNADPGGKGLDIWTDNVSRFSDIAYKAITPYITIPAEQETLFELREPGKTEDLSASRRLPLFGRHYTLVALPMENHSSRLAVMSDNLGLVEPGSARVRLINATPDVEDVDLYIAGSKTRLQHGIDASMVTSFTDVPAGVLEIRPADRPAPPQLSNLKVEADRLYTFVVVGKAAALDVVRIEDQIKP